MISEQLDDIIFDNPIWIASSPITERYSLIRKTIRAGAGAVVLKSAGDFNRNCNRICNPCGNRYIGYLQASFAGTEESAEQLFKESRAVFSTSNNSNYCERLTIKESNELVRQIKKEFGRSYPVISSFAPLEVSEFEKVYELEGDAIELNLRSIQRNFKTPFIISSYADSLKKEDFSKSDILKLQLFKDYIQKVDNAAIEFLKYKDRPTILKLDRFPYVQSKNIKINPNISRLLNLNYDGFTLFDSDKGSGYYSENGTAKQGWGKSSVSGTENLRLISHMFIKLIRSGNLYSCNINPKFLSASGGVYDISDINNLLEVGADSIQLCSTIYYFGYGQIRKIVDDIKNGTSKSKDSRINILDSNKQSPIHVDDILFWINQHKVNA